MCVKLYCAATTTFEMTKTTRHVYSAYNRTIHLQVRNEQELHYDWKKNKHLQYNAQDVLFNCLVWFWNGLQLFMHAPRGESNGWIEINMQRAVCFSFTFFLARCSTEMFFAFSSSHRTLIFKPPRVTHNERNVVVLSVCTFPTYLVFGSAFMKFCVCFSRLCIFYVYFGNALCYMHLSSDIYMTCSFSVRNSSRPTTWKRIQYAKHEEYRWTNNVKHGDTVWNL